MRSSLIWVSTVCPDKSVCTEISCDMTKPTNWVCAQRRLRSAWASSGSESLLGAHSFCWFCHVVAQIRNGDHKCVKVPMNISLCFPGNEGEGLPAEILDQCNVNIYIRPHKTQNLDSLNVSVATGKAKEKVQLLDKQCRLRLDCSCPCQNAWNVMFSRKLETVHKGQ